MTPEQRKKFDAVTVGQIRERQLAFLEKEISKLSGLIRDGYHKRHEAEALLNGSIAEMLTRLDNLDAHASAVVIFPDQRK